MSGDRRIYRNGMILRGRDLELLEGHALVVEKGIIAEIIPDRGPGNNAESIDLRGDLVIPGFVDAHTHIGDSICKEAGVGLPTIEAVSPPEGLKYRLLKELSPAELKSALKTAIEELAYCGITCFADFREGGAAGAAALKEVLADSPLRGIIFGEPAWSGDVSVRSNYLRAIEEILPAAEGIGIGDVADFQEDVLAELHLRAAEQGKKIAVHAAETPAAQARCLEIWNKTEIQRVAEHGADLLVHVTNPGDEDIEVIREKNIPLVLCVRTNAILADGIPPLYRLFDCGVPVALGTDNMMFTGPDMFREMDFVSRLTRVGVGDADALPPKRVLQAATVGGADALGLAFELGSLEPGKRADINIINMKSRNLQGVRDVYSALVHRASAGDIRGTLVSGESVFPF